MTKTLTVITARTDAEWPPDHPLRRQVSRVIGNDDATGAQFLICSEVGAGRLPPPTGDRDVVTACCKCGTPVVHRASAPKGPEPICIKCWGRIDG